MCLYDVILGLILFVCVLEYCVHTWECFCADYSFSPISEHTAPVGAVTHPGILPPSLAGNTPQGCLFCQYTSYTHCHSHLSQMLSH